MIPDTVPDSTTIQPGGYLLFWADGQPGQGVRHLGFKLGAGGEEIALVDADGISIIDQIVFSDQYEDISYGVYPEGTGEWQYLDPTPVAANVALGDQDVILYINEFMASNNMTIADKHGEYDDWVEIFNPNEYPVDIGGMFITDDLQEPAKYRIPDSYPDSTTIPPEGFLMIWTDSDDEQGILHSTFKLSAAGEEFGLVKANGIDFIDQVTFGEQMADISLGRYHDGEDNWLSYSDPTPGLSNLFVSRDEYLDAEFVVFPNPTSGTVNIQLASRHNEIHISVINLTGKIMLNRYFRNQSEVQFDLSSFERGIYMIHIKTEKDTYVTRLILSE